jgi:pimeloyl-ACP methyl ester carboxylesterase
VKLGHRRDGDPAAPVLVLAGSLGSTLAMWEPQLPLADRFRLVRYDHPGHGSSPPAEEPLTIDELGAAALALLAERRPMPLILAAAGLFPFVAALALWHGLGIADRSEEAFNAAMAGLREYFWSQRVLQWLPLAGAVGMARRSPTHAILLGAGVVGFATAQAALPHASFSDGLFFELLLPALPAYVLLVAALPLLVPTLAARLGDDARPAGLHARRSTRRAA